MWYNRSTLGRFDLPRIEGLEIRSVGQALGPPAYRQAEGKETVYIRAGYACQPLTISQMTR